MGNFFLAAVVLGYFAMGGSLLENCFDFRSE